MNRYHRLTRLISLSLISGFIFFPAIVHADDSNSTDEMFVSLERRPTPLSDTPANVTVITEQQIKDSGAKSLDEILGRTVGINVQQTGSLGTFSTLRVRGVPSSAQVKVLIDDQPYGGFAADQNIDISQIQLDNVERIEIVRGGSSVLYGANTTGGVIHVFTKKRPKGNLEANVGYEARSYETQIERGDVGIDNGRAFASANLNHYETNGFQRNTDANNINGGAAAGYVFPNAARVGLQYSRLDNNVGVAQGTTVPISEWDGEKERAAANPTKRQLHDRSEGRLTSDIPFLQTWHAQTSFFGSGDNTTSDSSIDPSEARFDQTSHVLGADVRLLSEFGFTAGFSYERDESRTTSYDTKHVTMTGGYLQQEFKNDRASLTPALRFDNNSNFGDVWNPRLTGVWHATPKWTVSGNIARSYRAPSFFDQFSAFSFIDFSGSTITYTSNKNIKPETSWTYDFGNEWRPNKDVALKAVGYYTTIHDRIVGLDPDGDGFDNTNTNASKAELVGVEFEEKAVWGRFTKWENYTYQRSRGYNANHVGSTDYVDLPFVPQHMFNIGVDVAGPSQTVLSNVVQYVGRQYTQADRQGTKLPTYCVWNIRFSKKFKIGEFFAGVNNVLNRRYTESSDFAPVTFDTTLNPMPDRNYVAGLTLRFLKQS